MSLTLARYESALSRALWQIRTYSSQHLSFGMPEARAGHDVASKPAADDCHIAANRYRHCGRLVQLHLRVQSSDQWDSLAVTASFGELTEGSTK